MDKPVRLHRFVEGSRRARRHPGAHLCDRQELPLPLRALFGCRQFARVLRVAAGICHHGTGRYRHGAQFFTLRRSVCIPQEIQVADDGLDILLEFQQPAMVNHIAQDRMSRCPLFHELREDASRVRIVPGRFHDRKDAIAHGAAAPDRDDLLPLDMARLVIDCIGDFLAAIQYREIFHAVTAQLRKCRDCFGGRSALADDQLPRPYVQPLVLQYV